jgi:hypothetical protein
MTLVQRAIGLPVWRGAALGMARRVGGVRRLSALPPHSFLPMPALSPTMTQGNLAAWKKAEGEEINVGDVIAEVETDKATVDYEAVDEGFVAKLLVSEGCVPHAAKYPLARLFFFAARFSLPGASSPPGGSAPDAASAGCSRRTQGARRAGWREHRDRRR